MTLRASLVSSVGLLILSCGVCLADCPTPSTPIVVPLVATGPTPLGASLLSADSALLAVQNPGVQRLEVYERGFGGWTFVGSVGDHLFSKVFAVRGDIIVGGNNSVAVMQRARSSGAWTTGPGRVLNQINSVLGIDGNTVVAAGAVIEYVWPPGSPPRRVVKVLEIAPDSSLVLRQELQDPGDPTLRNEFATSLAIEGELLVVGAYGDSQAGAQTGAVYVYRRGAGPFVLVQTIAPPAPRSYGGFGYALALNGGTLAVGAIRAAGGNVSFSRGEVHLYTWVGQQFSLAATLSHPRGLSDAPTGFGSAVSLRESRLLVSAPQDSLFSESGGAVYVFDRVHSEWRSTGAIGVSDGAGSWFGQMIALTDTEAVVVAPLHVRRLGAFVFDGCALPRGHSSYEPCTPGLSGLIAYLMKWFQVDPAADFNLDGEVDTTDLMDYLNAWLAGCP